MEIFDFVLNAGAKVGIGKSTDEIAAEEKVETDKKLPRSATHSVHDLSDVWRCGRFFGPAAPLSVLAP